MTDVYEYDDGTVPPTADFEVVVTDPDIYSRDVQVDAAAGKLYWTQLEVSSRDYQLWRADLDSTNPELLVDDLERAEQLVVDLDEGKIQWCGEDASANGLIQRANLDGSAFEADFITTGRNFSADLALNLDGPKTLYWCVWDGTDVCYEIRKAALDPLSAEADVVTSNSMLTAGMAYHDGYLYGGAPLWNRIYKLPDGGGNADAVEVRIAANVAEIALDVVAGKIYWAHDTSIYQAELDGREAAPDGWSVRRTI